MSQATTTQEFDAEFETKIIDAVAKLLRYGYSHEEILRRLDDSKRIKGFSHALNHWVSVGYTHATALALAAVLHGRDEDVRIWAKGIMERDTNLRLEDMI